VIDSADLREGLALVGLAAEDVPHVVAASDRSRQRIARARAALASLPSCPGIPVVLGSHGRHEAGTHSDFDFAYVHEAESCAPEDAELDRRACLGALRDAGFDVPEKTFHRAVLLSGLVANVGGPGDTHEHLTHRALLLTESAWLRDREPARAAWARLFGVYRDGPTRGRYVSSLLNDLHRYYRTVCLDYRHKIEEADKGWALRYMKLRHARKTLHLSNLVLHCAERALADERGGDGDGAGFDARLAAELGTPPLLKIARSLHALGDGTPCADLWRSYDAYLEQVDESAVRAELDALPLGEPQGEAFRRLKENAHRLDDAAERVVSALLADSRTRGHLVRFGLL
jgi:hypothetical protein